MRPSSWPALDPVEVAEVEFEFAVVVVDGAGVLSFEFELVDCTLESWLADIFVQGRRQLMLDGRIEAEFYSTEVRELLFLACESKSLASSSRRWGPAALAKRQLHVTG